MNPYPLCDGCGEPVAAWELTGNSQIIVVPPQTVFWHHLNITCLTGARQAADAETARRLSNREDHNAQR